MSAGQRVTLEDVRHVAALANLELTAAEEPRMQHDLNAILGHIAELNQLDTTGIEPMAQVSEVFAIEILPGTGRTDAARNSTEKNPSLRADIVQPSLDRAAVLAEAPETDGRFFKVPKVIER